MNILGTKVDYLSREEVLSTINYQLSTKKRKVFFIVTANGEFLLEAKKNPEFKKALQKADLILPDGVSLSQAWDFLNSSSKNPIILFFRGVYIGFKTLVGFYAKDQVTGVGILQSFLVRHSGEEQSDDARIQKGSWTIQDDKKKPSVFLLGGQNGVSKILAEKYKTDYYEGLNDITKITQKENKEIIEKINTIKPDILFVSFGHFRQEMWIADNLDQIKAKVVIGVGSAFDEIVGLGTWQEKTPEFFQKIGLKWLWRLSKNPNHLGRVFSAVIVFPWKIYWSQLKSPK